MSEAAKLVQRVEQSIAQRRLFRRGEAILVAVSGGLDSMVLLDVLAKLSSTHGWQLTVAHFNHHLRGRSSDADERLVERTAKKLKVSFVSGGAEVRKFAGEHKLSLEMAGRKLRHEFFAREASKRKIRRIALAHHADDQVELFLLRLLRGAGGEGLAGMKWEGLSPVDPKIRLSRPLLGLTKFDLGAYAKETYVPFREDATNAQLDFQRNRIRHELIPLLGKRYQPALARVILRQMEVLAAESELVTEMARKWLKGKREPVFDHLPLAVQRRCLQLQLVGLGLAPGFDLIEQLRTESKRPISVAEQIAVERDAAGMVHIQETGKPGFAVGRLEVQLKGRGGQISFENTRITWRFAAFDHGTFRAIKRPVNQETFDAAKVGEHIVLRHWQPGDRFQPIGMEKAVKLQDLFTNQKIPRAKRHQLLIGTTAAGELFWVEGLRLGELFKLDKNTRNRLKWSWERL